MVVRSEERVLVTSGLGRVSGMTPGSDRRSALGFVDAVLERFAFLEPFGLLLSKFEPTFVRYESEERFVNVFHGRSSYEIGVEVGRWVDTKDGVAVETYPLAYLDAIREQDSGPTVRGLTAVSREQVASFVAEVAGWAQVLLPNALTPSSDQVFAELQAEVVRESQLYLQRKRSEVLRERAGLAWREGDFHRVVLAYSEIIEELPLVSLRPSELKRLQYAEGRTGEVS